jgi:hypothetical protein
MGLTKQDGMVRTGLIWHRMEQILVNVVMKLGDADFYLGCDASSLGEWFPTFQISYCYPYSWSSSPRVLDSDRASRYRIVALVTSTVVRTSDLV